MQLHVQADLKWRFKVNLENYDRQIQEWIVLGRKNGYVLQLDCIKFLTVPFTDWTFVILKNLIIQNLNF